MGVCGGGGVGVWGCGVVGCKRQRQRQRQRQKQRQTELRTHKDAETGAEAEAETEAKSERAQNAQKLSPNPAPIQPQNKFRKPQNKKSAGQNLGALVFLSFSTRRFFYPSSAINHDATRAQFFAPTPGILGKTFLEFGTPPPVRALCLGYRRRRRISSGSQPRGGLYIYVLQT